LDVAGDRAAFAVDGMGEGEVMERMISLTWKHHGKLKDFIPALPRATYGRPQRASG
jgi:hypothetical protein